ncbi:hypothetical protein [Flavobacterium shii]|uniref:hypothetical protein n=1 Tax=Flavobacterium shii TaxID=2987687 RepID=UPI00384E16E8
MSHIHMIMNRQYTSKQRMYELIIYDHLYRYYKTVTYQYSSTKLRAKFVENFSIET